MPGRDRVLGRASLGQRPHEVLPRDPALALIAKCGLAIPSRAGGIRPAAQAAGQRTRSRNCRLRQATPKAAMTRLAGSSRRWPVVRQVPNRPARRRDTRRSDNRWPRAGAEIPGDDNDGGCVRGRLTRSAGCSSGGPNPALLTWSWTSCCRSGHRRRRTIIRCRGRAPGFPSGRARCRSVPRLTRCWQVRRGS
jgi:hypothetical protein